MKKLNLLRIGGTSAFCGLLLFSSAVAQTNYTVLKKFTGMPDGAVPICTLVGDKDGWLYGTTVGGGVSNMGTVFTVRKDGSGCTVLKSFVGNDGSSPYAGLALSTNGVLFGTTYGGGASNFGTVFKLNRDGTGFGVLHSFTGGSDGKNSQGALIEGSDGALYGTTVFSSSSTRGTVFKLNKDGSGYSIIHTFTGNPDGQQPICKLLEASDGNLYGTTTFGGSRYIGTVFKMNKDGNGYGVIYTFQNVSGNGYSPGAALMEGSDGFLYGSTSAGIGTAAAAGTIFKINKDGGGYGILRTFTSTGTDAQSPSGELIEGTNGALYGVTGGGGSSHAGTVYRINKDGSGYSLLFGFVPGTGSMPQCGLLQLNDGILYGTTQFGAGVFALSSQPLPPRLLSLSVSASSNLLQFTTTSSIQHTVQRSTDLSSWIDLATILSPPSGLTNYVDLNPPSGSAFYRLRVQ